MYACARSLMYVHTYLCVQAIFWSLYRYNKLAHIPESVRACVMLEELSLDGNVLTDLPVRINRGRPHCVQPSPHAHLTTCTPHCVHPHHMHYSPHSHLTTCTPHCVHPHHMHTHWCLSPTHYNFHTYLLFR